MIPNNLPDDCTEADIEPRERNDECPNCGMTGRHDCQSMSERAEEDAWRDS